MTHDVRGWGRWWTLRATDESLILLLLVIPGLALAAVTPAQNDTWWHLRSGLEMWVTGAPLTTEPFSHTNAGSPLGNHWWLSQLLFYGLFSAGGPVLLTLVAGLCALAAICGAYRRTAGTWEWRISMFALLLIATAPEWSVRPQVISLLFLVLCTHLLARGRIEWLPVVCLVWANVHAMVVFGVVVAGAVCAESFMPSSTTGRGRAIRVLCGCLVAPLISPLGWHYWPQVLGTISVSRELNLQEYRPPLSAADILFWAIAIALAYYAVKRRRELLHLSSRTRALLFVAGALAVATLMAARNLAFFAVVAIPALSQLVWLDTPVRVGRLRSAQWPAYLLVGLMAAGAGLFVQTQWRDGGTSLGWQPLSPDAIAAVRDCPGPLFNTMFDGGPLMWFVPERRVFVDSRMEAYPAALLRRVQAAELRGDYAELFDDYGVRCVIVPADSLLDEQLRTDPAMEPVASDSRHQVYELLP